MIQNDQKRVQKVIKNVTFSKNPKKSFLPVLVPRGVAKKHYEKGPVFRWKVPSPDLQKGGLFYKGRVQGYTQGPKLGRVFNLFRAEGRGGVPPPKHETSKWELRFQSWRLPPVRYFTPPKQGGSTAPPLPRQE